MDKHLRKLADKHFLTMSMQNVVEDEFDEKNRGRNSSSAGPPYRVASVVIRKEIQHMEETCTYEDTAGGANINTRGKPTKRKRNKGGRGRGGRGRCGRDRGNSTHHRADTSDTHNSIDKDQRTAQSNQQRADRAKRRALQKSLLQIGNNELPTINEETNESDVTLTEESDNPDCHKPDDNHDAAVDAFNNIAHENPKHATMVMKRMVMLERSM